MTFTLEMRASISVNSIHSFDQNTDADIAISHAKETERKNKRRKALQPCLGFLKGLHTLQTLSKFIKEKIADLISFAFPAQQFILRWSFLRGWSTTLGGRDQKSPQVSALTVAPLLVTRDIITHKVFVFDIESELHCVISAFQQNKDLTIQNIQSTFGTHWVTVSGLESPSCSVLHHITGQVMRFVPSNSACIITCSLCRFVILEKLKFIYFFGKSFSFKRQSNSISKGLHGSYPPLEALIRPGRAPIFITLGTGQGWCW